MNEPRDPLIDGQAEAVLQPVRSARASTDGALAIIYAERRTELFGFLVGMTRDREAAEELLQDTFVRLIRETRAGRPPSDVRPWLYRVAANAAISRGRRGRVALRALPRLFERPEVAPPEGEILRREQHAALRATLANLAPDGRAALLLAAQGFDGREIAAAIGRSEGATRTLLCRSRVRLRLLLETGEGQP